MQVQSLGQENALEEGMATHSRVLAWRIPWTEESGGLQSIGSQRVRRDRARTHILSYGVQVPWVWLYLGCLCVSMSYAPLSD